MGGSQEAEGNRRGAGTDGARAVGGDAGAGVGCYGHARRQNAGTIDSGSGADTEGVLEVHGLSEGVW